MPPCLSRSRSGDDDTVPMVDALAWQHAYVSAAGSPTAALILSAVEGDLRSGGALAGLLPTTVRFGDLPGLRVMAVVHRLALERRAPAVALHLPTMGGTAPGTPGATAGFERAVVALLAAHPREVRESLARTPQTNETGRAALLRCALSRLGGLPVRLHEIGASAGLNLRADHLPGDPALEAGPLPPIVERIGCDLAPVDPTTPEGRAQLGSYVWVDDTERFARLGRALDVAVRVPATVLRRDAADFVSAMTLQPGTRTVLWHSAMWVYLPPTVRQGVLDARDRLGRQAHAGAPLAHVSWEWDPDGGSESDFVLVIRRWEGAPDDGHPETVARGRSHGMGIVLTGE